MVARCSRIYPVVIVALITTTLADSIGNYVNHSNYVMLNDKFSFYAPITLPALLRYLTFTNEIWSSHVVYGSDEPFWSLGFEVWYYIMFGVAVFSPVKIRYVLVAVVMFCCGPKILAYFPLWMMGFFSYRSLRSNNMPLQTAKMLFGASIVCSVVLVVVLRRLIHPTNMFETVSLWQAMSNILYCYALGCCVSLNIISFDRLTKDRQVWSAAWERRIRWAAGASFTLYLVHQPLEVMISALVPDIGSHLPLGMLAVLSVGVSAAGLAELGERRKRAARLLITPIVYPARKRLAA